MNKLINQLFVLLLAFGVTACSSPAPEEGAEDHTPPTLSEDETAEAEEAPAEDAEPEEDDDAEDADEEDEGNEEDIDVADIPQAILDDIAGRDAAAEILEAEKVTADDGTVTYEVEISHKGGTLEVIYAEDGTFIDTIEEEEEEEG